MEATEERQKSKPHFLDKIVEKYPVTFFCGIIGFLGFWNEILFYPFLLLFLGIDWVLRFKWAAFFEKTFAHGRFHKLYTVLKYMFKAVGWFINKFPSTIMIMFALGFSRLLVHIEAWGFLAIMMVFDRVFKMKWGAGDSTANRKLYTDEEYTFLMNTQGSQGFHISPV